MISESQRQSSGAVEAALRSKQLRVYAVEHGEEACGLIAENASRTGVKNLYLSQRGNWNVLELPVPTCAFIGPGGGGLKFFWPPGKNPNVRVVLNAISLRTVAEIMLPAGRNFDLWRRDHTDAGQPLKRQVPII